MENTPKQQTVYNASTSEQRKALASPVRQEILGHFAGTGGLSVAELAERMGRPPTALYYHVSHLEELGILEPAGERLKGKRYENVYRPAADVFEIDAEQEESIDDVIRTLEVAMRTSIRELKDALENDRGRKEGPERNLIGFRLQGPVHPDTLATINEHVDAILETLAGTCREQAPLDTADYISLTLALAPLRGRQHRGGEQ